MRPLLAGVLAALACAATAQAGPILFPVVVAEPVERERPLPDDGPLFTQKVRSETAVRVARDAAIAYRPRILDRKVFGGAAGGLTLRAGTVFVEARLVDGRAYCAAVAPRKENLLTFFDVGLCLRDGDVDGVFDQQLVFEPTQRIRTPYEVTEAAALGAVVWEPTQVAYEALRPEAIPAGEVRITYRSMPVGVRGRAALRPQLCWPAELVLPGAAKDGEPLCSILLPPGFRLPRIGEDVAYQQRGAAEQTISWGAVSVRLSDRAGAYVAPLPAGPGEVFQAGALRNRGDAKFQQSIQVIGPARVEAPGSAASVAPNGKAAP